MNYYKIDLIDRNGECSGSSYCVKCEQKLTDEEAINAAMSLDLIDRDDLEEYDTEVTDITSDKSELDAFSDIAELFVKQ